jgi:Tol biopolymer transport system component
MNRRTRLACAVATALLGAGCGSPTAAVHHPRQQPPTASEPGSLIAYEDWDAKARAHRLYVVDIDTRRPRLVAPTDDQPAWSPDGNWLAVAAPANRTRKCGECSDLTLVPVNGGERRVLATGGVNTSPSWSPDGKWITFSHGTSESTSDFELDATRPDGASRHRLAGKDGRVTWSPDSRRLVIDTILDGLWIVGADGAGLRRLTPAPAYADRTQPRTHDRSDGSPEWSPHGDSIVFDRFDGVAGAPHVSIWIVSAASGRQHRVSPPNISGGTPAWSPDGRLISFVGSVGSASGKESVCSRSAVYTVRPDGSELRRISPTVGSSSGQTAWSPDGRYVAFIAAPAGTTCLADTSGAELDVVSVSGASRGDIAAAHPPWQLGYVAWQP